MGQKRSKLTCAEAVIYHDLIPYLEDIEVRNHIALFEQYLITSKTFIAWGQQYVEDKLNIDLDLEVDSDHGQ